MAHFRKLIALAAALMMGAQANAAPQTPPNLSTAGTVNNADLLVVWPCTPSCSLGGPLENVPFSTVKSLVVASVTGTFAQVANNLSDLTSSSTARTNLGLGSAALQSSSAFLQASNNLSDVSSVSTARTHLGLGTAATQNTTAFLQVSNNLSDIGSASTARTNLGLGTAATQASSAFLQASNNLSELVSPSTARTNLGLGTAATSNTSAFLQPSNNLSDVSSATTARTNLGLGGAAVLDVGTGAGKVAAGDDSRFAGPTQLGKSAAYGFLASDAGGQVYHPSADTTARTWTIPANASVAFAVGTKIELVNDCSAGAITIAITSDTLEWFPSGTTGSRTLAACGQATLTKITTTEWSVIGVGLS